MVNIVLHVRSGYVRLQACGLTCLFVFCSWPARCCPCSTRPSIRRRNRRKICSSSSPCTAVPRCSRECCQVHSIQYSPHIPRPSVARVSHWIARPVHSSSSILLRTRRESLLACLHSQSFFFDRCFAAFIFVLLAITRSPRFRWILLFGSQEASASSAARDRKETDRLRKSVPRHVSLRERVTCAISTRDAFLEWRNPSGQ